MRAIATALSLLLTLSISPLSSPLLGQPVPVRAFDEPSLHTFDAMGPDGVVAPLGWRAGSSDATLTRNLQVGSVHSATPGAYNVPGSSPNDRAVGFLQGKGRAGVIDVRFRNSTGSPIDAISIAFDAVQWKFSSDTRAQSGLELLYSSDGVTFVRLGDRFSYHAVPDLDFRPLISKNQSVRVMARISGRWILPSLLPPEAECVLRWRSTNSQIDGVGFAVDNVRFEAHPVLPTRDGDGFVTLHNPLLQDSQIFRPGISQPAVLQMRGRPGGSLTTLTVNIPEGWSIGSEASVEHDGPAFEGADLSVEEDKIVIRNADLTDTKTGRLVLGECVPPMPATSGPRVFRVFTSTSERPGIEIQESPKIVLLSTVESLRRKEWTPSPEEEIAVEGTLICPYSADNTQGEFFVEDHGSGLRVVFEEQRLSFGEYEKLLVRGRYVEDRARPTVLVTESFSLGTGRVATLRPSSIREIVAEPRRFEGSLVIVRNVRKARSSVAPWPPLLNRSTQYYLTDGDARDSLLLLIHPSSGLDEAPEPRYPLTIRGIITRRNGDGVHPGTLTILPRTASDLDPVLTPPAPQARVPSQDEENVSLMPSLEWDLVGDATTYHLQISTDSTFGSIVAGDSVLTGSSFRCPQLEPEEVYYWRVRALNADGAGPFSEQRRFSTIAHPTVRIIDPASEEPLLTSSVALHVARTGFWYEGEQDAPTESFQHQNGFLKISVGESIQGYVESDSLWIVRLVHGENVVTVELVDSEHRSLVPTVADSVRLTVSDDAWVIRAAVGGPSASFPVLHNSSSVTLRPELHQGDGHSDGPAESALAVRVDGRLAGQVSSDVFSLSALTPGLHRIRVELVDREGTPHAPNVFDEFSISIPDSAPYLRIASPVSGDTLDGSQNSVTLVRRNLQTREATGTNGGAGIFQAFVLSVKGVPVDTSASDTISVGSLVEGPALVRVEALTVQGIPFDPPVFDEVRVVVRAPVENAKLLEQLEAYVLEQNYPNPFNAETEIRFSLPVAGHATVRVFNLLGQEVALLLDSDVEAGPHTVRWNGLNDSGKKVSSGIYLFRLQSGPYVGTRRMLLVK